MPGLANMEPIPTQPAVKSEEERDDFLLDEEVQEDEASYKARPQLPKPRTFLRTLGCLMSALEAGVIDVDPEYQRDVVWTADRMTGLVNSFMENFYIPPIILNEKPRPTKDNATSQLTFVCVDGKQRLSSVRAFINGIIPCNDHRGEKWWFCITRDTPGGRNKKTLPKNVQEEFLSKELVSIEYAGLSQEQEEDLFSRVQMGVQLTPAEKMRASTGPWQELARCYVDDFPVIYSLLKDRARAKDFQMTLSCFSQIIEVQHPTAPNGIPILKTNYNHLPKLLENKSAVDDGVKSHLASVWNTFQDLIRLDPNTFTNADKRLRGVQTFAPVEMVAVTVLISMYSESRNTRLLIDDIQALRDELRENFADLRLNTPLWKFVWNFMDNLEQRRGAVDKTTVDRSIKAKPALAQRAPTTPASPTVKLGRPTARTKPTTVLPGGSNITTEREAATPPANARPKKRLRVGSVPAVAHFLPLLPSPANLLGSFRAITSPVDTSHPNIEFLGTVSKSASSTAPSAQKTWQTQTPMSGRLVVVPPLASGSTSQRIPLVNPDETRQNRISELNSYRAPIAQLGPMVPLTTAAPTGVASTTSPTMPTTFEGNLWSLPSRTMPPPPTRSSVFTSRPIRSPSSRSQEVMHSVSPIQVDTRPAAPTAPPTSRPCPKAPPRPIPQYDGVIDLTGDDE